MNQGDPGAHHRKMTNLQGRLQNRDKHLMETQPLSDQKRKFRDAMEKTREKLQKSKERAEEEKRAKRKVRKKEEMRKEKQIKRSSPCSLIILMTS